MGLGGGRVRVPRAMKGQLRAQRSSGGRPAAWLWCCLVSESTGFAQCHPEVSKALCAAVGLFGWLRRDAGGPAACGAAWGAACAQPLLPLPEKPTSASSEEKAPGVPEVPERMCCSTCGQVFGSREEQVSAARWSVGAGVWLVWLQVSCCRDSAPALLFPRAPLPKSCWDLSLRPCMLLLKMSFTGGKWYRQHGPAPLQINCYMADSLTYCDLPVRITTGSQNWFSPGYLPHEALWWGLVSMHLQDPADSHLFPSQTEHYRLDWHRFNLKQRLLGRRTLPVEVFEEKTHAGEEQGCPQQSPEPVSSLAVGVLCRNEAPGYLCQLRVPLFCPVGFFRGPVLPLSSADLLWGEGGVLPEPLPVHAGDPEP